jgi:hypothetical protein
MEDYAEVYKTITKEVTEDNPDVRAQYLKHFGAEVAHFCGGMANAFLNWRTLDNTVKGDQKLAHISGLVYSAITLLFLIANHLQLIQTLMPN